MRSNICLAALAATLVTATPAVAQQASATAEARGLVLQPLTLTNPVGGELDFGTVSGDPLLSGTVVIGVTNPLAPTRTKTGGVTLVPSAWQPARFDATGEPNRNVIVTLLAPATLTSGANSITVNSMVFDTCSCTSDVRTTDAAGLFSIYVGGDFAIAANQPAGLYTANFDVTADYQ